MRAHPRSILTHRRLAVALALALAAGFAAQTAAAQSYVGPAEVDEVVVTPLPRFDRDVARMSRAVSYADLDLTTYAGQRMLEWRVRDTARSICRALGESPTATSGVTRSCQADAVRSARPQLAFAVRRAYAQAATTAYAALDPPAAYVAPLND